MRFVILGRLAACVFLFIIPAGSQAQSACTGDACSVVKVRFSAENCYANPTTEPGVKVYIDNADGTRRVHVRVIKQGISPGFPTTDDAVDQEAPAQGSGQIGCSQLFTHAPPPDHIV